jgi:diacylglycerol kinase (ATP)
MEKKNSRKFSLKSRLGSFRFAINGLRSLLKYEHNSRIHLVAAILVIIAAILLKVSLSEWAILAAVMGIVFLTELLNSAIETLSDLIEPRYNEVIRTAKDYSAAAVLISALIALVVGCLIFIPKILSAVFNLRSVQ